MAGKIIATLLSEQAMTLSKVPLKTAQKALSSSTKIIKKNSLC